MTSFRQLEANRRNATRSTGPITESGKHRSRRNAVRHGLCSETVIGLLEDIEDYRGFEAAIIADYDAETAVEREFLKFLKEIGTLVPEGLDVHIVMDNYATDKTPKIKAWLRPPAALLSCPLHADFRVMDQSGRALVC